MRNVSCVRCVFSVTFPANASRQVGCGAGSVAIRIVAKGQFDET